MFKASFHWDFFWWLYVFENNVIMIATWTDFFFIQLQWLTSVGFFPHRMCSHVYFNFCVNLAAPWYILVKWTYILEAMMHRFPSIWQTVSSNFLAYSLIYSQIHINMFNPHVLMARNYHPLLNFLFTYLFSIKNSLLFHLFFLNLQCILFVSIFIQSYVNSNLQVSTK